MIIVNIMISSKLAVVVATTNIEIVSIQLADVKKFLALLNHKPYNFCNNGNPNNNTAYSKTFEGENFHNYKTFTRWKIFVVYLLSYICHHFIQKHTLENICG